MTRRYVDVVEVRANADRAPTAFLWRGRLYVVCGVLGHWRERRVWWAGSAARVLHGEDGDPDESGREGDGASRRIRELGEEHEVWRVEASRGQSHSVGVYDLSNDVSNDVSENQTGDVGVDRGVERGTERGTDRSTDRGSDRRTERSAWRLLRVSD